MIIELVFIKNQIYIIKINNYNGDIGIMKKSELKQIIKQVLQNTQQTYKYKMYDVQEVQE